jgi:hypothetical protein
MDSTLYEKLTPIQKRMLAVLADGRKHPRQELWAALGDELAPISNIRFHLVSIRRALAPTGELIHVFTEPNGDGKLHTLYQWVKVVPREAR